MCAGPERMRAQRGTSLVEVIIFVVIVSIAVVSVVSALSLAVRQSGDPLVQRQTLAIAESLIQEIDSQPYAQKDPYNPTGPARRCRSTTRTITPAIRRPASWRRTAPPSPGWAPTRPA